MKKIYILTVLLLGVSLILNIYFYVSRPGTYATDTDNPTTLKYSYLSPRVQRTMTNEIFLNFSPLRKALRNYTTTQNIPIFVYFEYLPSGTSIGILDSTESPTASLIKVPTVMAVYSKIEKNELSINQNLTLTPDAIDNNFGTFWKNDIGTTISIHDAIVKTIVESDNTTHKMLYNLLSEEERLDIFEKLDIQKVSTEKGDSFEISPKSYASILKSLYFSTYLTQKSSQEILEIMTHSTDKSKLPAGISDSITIAHKIGVTEREPGKFYYHDCGIIYVPKRPYILCVMVQHEEDKSIEIIKTISKLVYEYISSVN